MKIWTRRKTRLAASRHLRPLRATVALAALVSAFPSPSRAMECLDSERALRHRCREVGTNGNGTNGSDLMATIGLDRIVIDGGAMSVHELARLFADAFGAELHDLAGRQPSRKVSVDAQTVEDALHQGLVGVSYLAIYRNDGTLKRLDLLSSTGDLSSIGESPRASPSVTVSEPVHSGNRSAQRGDDLGPSLEDLLGAIGGESAPSLATLADGLAQKPREAILLASSLGSMDDNELIVSLQRVLGVRELGVSAEVARDAIIPIVTERLNVVVQGDAVADPAGGQDDS